MHDHCLTCLRNPYHDKYQPREMKVERNIILLGNATIYNLCYDPSALRGERQSGDVSVSRPERNKS